MKKIILFIFLFIFSFSVVSGTALADSYDLYVDADCDESDADGSEDKPFCSIEDALDEASKGDSIFIKNGTYDEDIKLDEDISLEGEDNDDTKIKGMVEMDDGSSLKNLTIAGSNINVLILEDADAEISDCVITDAEVNGIQAESGDGKLTVDDSNIYNNDKGFYIESGKEISITDSKIHDNDEEGIDLRGGISGTIANNNIYDNGEGGIELIVGKADLSIKSNSIKNNGASGIAHQFYKSWSKLGDVSITSNTISDNDKYGIDCNAPSGGTSSMVDNYWKQSISFKDNKIEDNKKGAENSYCKFSDDEDDEKEEEEEDTATAEIADADRESAIQTANASVEEEKSEADIEIENNLKKIEDEFSSKKEVIHALITEMNEEGSWKLFFVGYSPKKIAQIENFKKEAQAYLEELKTLSFKTGNPSIGDDLQVLTEEMEKEIASMEKVLEQIDEIFSLFGGLRKFTYKLFHK